MQFEDEQHKPVMVNEVLSGLNIQKEGRYIDATLGRGGHARAILEQLGPTGRLFALDKDPAALPTATLLGNQDPRFVHKHSSFAKMTAFCEEMHIAGSVDGVLMDLGVSSPQLDTAERGFSFRLDGPLDMRMDPTSGQSAAEWISSAEESQIGWVLKTYGEERFHRRIARAIVLARLETPITTTLQLANIVSKANPAWEKHKHPATRSFQAIRIFINQELEEVTAGLEQSLHILKKGGRLVVISFHSLEDRIVKHFIQKHERGEVAPRHLPLLHHERGKRLRRIGKKMKPSDSEIEQNSRSRSAILRIAEKVGD